MRKTKLTVKPTTAFKKDYKLAIKRGLQIELLETVIETLAMANTLPPENRDHDLTGKLAWTSGVPHSARLASDLPR